MSRSRKSPVPEPEAVFVIEPGVPLDSRPYLDYVSVLEDNGGWHDGWEVGIAHGVRRFYWWTYVPKSRLTRVLRELRRLGFDATTEL